MDEAFADVLAGLSLAISRLDAVLAGRFQAIAAETFDAYGMADAKPSVGLRRGFHLVRFAAEKARRIIDADPAAGANALPPGYAEAVALTAFAVAAAIDNMNIGVEGFYEFHLTYKEADTAEVMAASSAMKFTAQVFRLGLARAPSYSDSAAARSYDAVSPAIPLFRQDAGAVHAAKTLAANDSMVSYMFPAEVAAILFAVLDGTDFS